MTLLIFIIWIILNGKINAEIILFGIGISLLIFIFANRFLSLTVKKELWIYRNYFLFSAFLLIVLRDIFIANYKVISFVISPKKEAVPAIVTFKTSLKLNFIRALLANSITITPGTITVSLDNDTFTVHCLDEELTKDLEDSTAKKILSKIEATYPYPDIKEDHNG